MKTSDFDYQLPESLIAQFPLEQRSDSRLLQLNPLTKSINDREFKDFTGMLGSDDLLIFNNTRVFPARLFGNKASGGKVEVLVERLLDEHRLVAHVRSSKAPRPGTGLILEGDIQCRVTGRDDALFHLELDQTGDWLSLLQQFGHMPLPPYIQRQDQGDDRERYQTVFAQKTGAVAAPTAGLHFDETILEDIRSKGIETAFVTLHVGAGTFQPVRVDDVSNHIMHAEWIEVSQEICEKIEHTRQKGGRVVAVGTTVVRSLESAAREGKLKPFSGDTRLFITPGFDFHVVDAMLTNFHLPKSTLLMLVSAFAGKEFMMSAYRHAVDQSYRFFSYGDAMFIENRIP